MRYEPMHPVERLGHELVEPVDRNLAVADATVQRVGDELQAAIRRTVEGRERRKRRRRRTGFALAAATAGVLALSVSQQPWRSSGNVALAASPSVKIYPVGISEGLSPNCFRVEGSRGGSRIRCPAGKRSRFSTYAMRQGSRVSFYGRAAIPGAVRVLLRFPGAGSYAVELQRSGYWAWDAPSTAVLHARRGLVVLALARDGRVLAWGGRIPSGAP